MPRTLPGTLLMLLLSAGAVPLAVPEEVTPARGQDSPHIAALSVGKADGQLVASFRLDSVFDADIQGRIASGLETVIEYRLEVIRRRRFWLDERTVQRRILASTRYDSLSRQHSLLLKVDGEVERSSTTDKDEEMRRWMSEIEGIPLGPASGFTPSEEYVVRVKAILQPHFVLLFIPWDRDTPWVRAPLPAADADLHGTGR